MCENSKIKLGGGGRVGGGWVWGGGGRVRGGGQGGCEWRSEAFVKIQKIKNFFGGWGGGGGEVGLWGGGGSGQWGGSGWIGTEN